ncbi:MAG: hypothetical protein ABSG31_13035 [Tepidisphaeraceae bacterium]
MLKPSQRRQMNTWLKRAMRLGERIGDFAVRITMHRSGKAIHIEADVKNSRGAVAFRSRQNDWQDAVREIVRMLTAHLHDQLIHPA